VVGVPGRVVRINGKRPERDTKDILDHAHLPDPVTETLRDLANRVGALERVVACTMLTDQDTETPKHG
jgi:hypothetical protein